MLKNYNPETINIYFINFPTNFINFPTVQIFDYGNQQLYPCRTPAAARSAHHHRQTNVAFTTPSNYAERLSSILTLKGFNPLWLPTITTHSTPHTKSSLKPYLRPPPNSAPNHPPPINDFAVLAFTSRAGISAFRDAVEELDRRPLLPDGGEFVIAALGYDSVLLDDAFVDRVCENVGRVRIAVPEVATPSGLVAELGLGRGRKVLCPVPLVVGMEEPPVVPGFLNELEKSGWVAVRVDAYETRWAGAESGRRLVAVEENVDAVVFTSTGEVEGLLKSLKEMGWDWGMVRRKWPQLVVAAHGPVTAAGAERLGVDVDLVSSRFGTFEGVVDALHLRLSGS
uniref:Tetrapyrrole biosynthesis uroporphyrinogen III synthase domain-containing protein n=1 Tax=Kalanchoe fedtschenkoi TaxID=63787 RepID=A0A7N0RFC6_KALFE